MGRTPATMRTTWMLPAEPEAKAAPMIRASDAFLDGETERVERGSKVETF